VTGSGYNFDPVTPRDRRVMKTRSRPWHRTADPGVDQGGGIPSDPIVIGDLVRFHVEVKNSIDVTAPGGPEMVATLEKIIAVLVENLPLSPDRPGGPRGGFGDGPGGIIEY